MIITDILGFLPAIFVLFFVGNSFFSWITLRKPIKLSTFEVFAISLCLGMTFIVLYGFCVEIIVSTFGLIPNSQVVLFVGVPIGIALALKLSSIKLQIGKKSSLWVYLRAQIALGKEKIRKICAGLHPRNLDRNRAKKVIVFGVVFVAVVLLFLIIFETFTLTPAQFSIDPIIWVYYITQYVDTFMSSYTYLVSYASGILSIDGFFLSFFYYSPFSVQYSFLKWFPLYLFGLFIFLLYVIHKRVSSKSVFFVVTFVLTFNIYFYYRFTMLTPSPLTIILLELFVLELLIPELPRYFAYLTLGTTLVIHPLNGMIICGFYFIYQAVEGLNRIYHYFNARRSSQKKTDLLAKKLLVKRVLSNIVAFVFPISIFIIYMTIRYSPNWIQFYLGVLFEGGIAFASTPPILDVGTSQLIFLPLFTNGSFDFSMFWTKVDWITHWGNVLFWFTLICICIPQKIYIKDTQKQKFVLFLRVSLLLTCIIFLLPGLGFFLDFVKLLPGGAYITNFVNSEYFHWMSMRLYEVSNILNALFILMFLEGIIRTIFHRAQGHPNPPKVKKIEILCIALLTSSLFVGTYITYQPYYEYIDNASYYAESFLWFRDYLDQQDPGAKDIQYTREDTAMTYPLSSFVTPERNFSQVCCNLSVEFIVSNFTSNPANTVKYLIISFFNVNETIANDVRTAYVGSSCKLFYNIQILILKF